MANYYSGGPATRDRAIFRHVMRGSRMFAQGNLFDGKIANWDQINYDNGANESEIRLHQPLKMTEVTTQTAEEAYESVVQNVGATLPKRDAIDLRLIQEVQERKGANVPDSKSLVWPKLKSAKAPADSDNDGMPDEWELKYDLTPHRASNNDDKDKDGYTDLEEFLNKTNPQEKNMANKNMQSDISPR